MLICKILLLLGKPPERGDLFEMTCGHHLCTACDARAVAYSLGYDGIPVLPVVTGLGVLWR